MDELDSDNSLLSHGGRTAERDIVQFVEMQRWGYARVPAGGGVGSDKGIGGWHGCVSGGCERQPRFLGRGESTGVSKELLAKEVAPHYSTV